MADLTPLINPSNSNGTIIPAMIPCIALEVIKTLMVGAKPDKAEAMVKPTMSSENIFLRTEDVPEPPSGNDNQCHSEDIGVGCPLNR
jgi:hypothetical protein